MENRLMESVHDSRSVTSSVCEPTFGMVTTPIEVYRGITIRRIENFNSPVGEGTGQYCCRICGVILKGEVSIENLKKKINDEFTHIFESLPSAP